MNRFYRKLYHISLSVSIFSVYNIAINYILLIKEVRLNSLKKRKHQVQVLTYNWHTFKEEMVPLIHQYPYPENKAEETFLIIL